MLKTTRLQSSMKPHQDRKSPEQQKTACASCSKKSCSATQRQDNESEEEFSQRQKLQSRLCRIRHKIVVLSGKGGVGKSTVSVNLAMALVMAGRRVGLLDVDIHGPSIPTMLGIENEKLHGDEDGLTPVFVGNLAVMSLGFILKNQDEAVIWRGPRKMSAIRQFLTEVNWGDLDCLVVDSPPGTGDEPLSVCQLIGDMDGAIIVTTPQKVAAVDVRKSVTFCRQLGVRVLGVVENMNGFVCPKCGEITQIFPAGEGSRVAEDMGLPFLGSLPIDPDIALAGDNGQAFVQQFKGSPTARIMEKIVAPLLALVETGPAENSDNAALPHNHE
jgi:Mrp family chromosome partitioning ATPase